MIQPLIWRLNSSNEVDFYFLKVSGELQAVEIQICKNRKQQEKWISPSGHLRFKENHPSIPHTTFRKFSKFWKRDQTSSDSICTKRSVLQARLSDDENSRLEPLYVRLDSWNCSAPQKAGNDICSWKAQDGDAGGRFRQRYQKVHRSRRFIFFGLQRDGETAHPTCALGYVADGKRTHRVGS